MSDPMTPEVRDWMKRTDVEPPDVQQSARQVRARLPEVRQRRRWWPFPVFYRKPDTPSTEDPASIPATYGRTPTVIWRTSSMFSPVKAITAGAIVFAVGGTFLIAQPFGQQGSIPGAEGDEAVMEVQEDASYFTGEMIWEGAPPLVAGEDTIVDGVLHARGTLAEGDAIEVSDPRVSGPLTVALNANVYQLSESEMAMFRTVEWRIENDAGSWTGQGTNLLHDSTDATELAGGHSSDITTVVFTGEGDYEGFTAYMIVEWLGEDGLYAVEGAVFPGEAPPYPELSSLAE